MPIQTCFESEVERTLYRYLNREGILLDEWLEAKFGILDSASRKKLADGFTQTEFPTEDWLPTVEFLRSSLILNLEQMSHCFSILPQTQKNKALKECFSFYLRSPLCQDKWSLLWDWIGELKTKHFSRFGSLELCLVPTQFSTYLFQELVRTLQVDSPYSDLQIQSLSDLWGEPRKLTPGNVTGGTDWQVLDSLAQKVAQDLGASPQHKALITFSGTPESKAYFLSRLSSLGLESGELNQPTPVSSEAWPLLLKRVRSQTSLTFEKKLELNTFLLHNPPRFEENMADYKKRLQQMDSFLLSFIEPIWDEPPLARNSLPAKSTPVTLTPWMNLPNVPGFFCYSFSDESLLEAPESHLLLSQQELEQLFFSGFQLPRWSELITHRLEMLRTHAHGSHLSTFSSLPLEHLSGLQVNEAPLPIRAPKTNPQNFNAQLSIKAFSATQLEAYSDCPSKYLYRRLKLNESQGPSPNLRWNLDKLSTRHSKLFFFRTHRPPFPLLFWQKHLTVLY